MTCEHRLTPDPRSGIRFCAKCGMDERKVKQEQQVSTVDDAIADAMVDANLSPKFCIDYAVTLQAFGRAVWDRALGVRATSTDRQWQEFQAWQEELRLRSDGTHPTEITKEDEMELFDVVMRLTGPIDPVGDSAIDAQRNTNLRQLCALVGVLLRRIEGVAEATDDHLASVKAAKEFAVTFLAAYGVHQQS